MRGLKIALVALFLATSLIYANSFNIKGTVKDKKSGEALPYANINILGTSYGTTTNIDGYYVLVNVPTGLCSLRVSYIGYETQTVATHVIKNQTVNFDMQPKVLEMQGVTVTANAALMETGQEVSQITISPKQLNTLPNLGEVDVFRSLQLLPGVSGVSDGSSGLYVRGGTPDQNLVIFDGMTIYHVDHFFGFFSAFNADAIKDIQLYKGGFASGFGGRLSSVVNLTGKTGDINQPQFGYSMNMLSAKAYYETPIKNFGSFLVTGRRSFTDLLRSPLYNDIYELMTGDEQSSTMGGPVQGRGRMGNQMSGEMVPSFYFYDFNSKLTLNPSTKDVITFSLYSGKDNLDKSQEFQASGFRMQGSDTEVSMETSDFTRWGNLGYSGKWSRQWTDKLHVDVLGAFSNYYSEYDRSINASPMNQPVAAEGDTSRAFRMGNATQESNTVQDISYKLDFDWQIAQNHRLDFGIHSSAFDNDFTASRDDTLTILSRKNQALLYAGYIQDKWSVKNVELTLGFRGSHYDQTQKMYYEPRASLSIPLGHGLTANTAWGHYYQFVNRISNEDVTQGARDFWMLADDEFAPSFAEHIIAGLNYENDNYLFTVEGYYKDLDNVVEFTRRFINPRQQNTYFYSGTGIAKGVEFLLQKKRGMLTGWLGYTLGNVKYTMPDLFNGITYNANHDRTHEVNAVAKYLWGVYTFSATWVFATGNPYTSPESQYYIDMLNGTSASYVHVGEKNAQRLPDYHRLDLGVIRKWETDNWEWDAGISVFNAYNHKNVWYRDYNLDTTPITVTDVTMLGLTPTVSIQVKLK